MSPFEFAFSLFGLLLGFSLVEVLGGLARTLEARLRLGAAFRVGWLTPLLALFVMLDLVTFWLAAWTVRGGLQVTGATLTAGLLFASAYYLAAHLVFPRPEIVGPDLDAHGMRVKRWTLGILWALFAVQVGYYLTVPALAAPLAQWGVVANVALFAVLLGAAALARGRRVTIALLAALIVRYLVNAF